jgi:hypothetical protein
VCPQVAQPDTEPPFGRSCAVVVALAAATSDRGFTAHAGTLRAALRDYVDMLPDAAWGSALAPAAAALRRHAPTVFAAVALCDQLKVSPRCFRLRQALASAALQHFLPLPLVRCGLRVSFSLYCCANLRPCAASPRAWPFRSPKPCPHTACFAAWALLFRMSLLRVAVSHSAPSGHG